MKKIKLLVASLLVATAFVNAQTQISESFNYQAVARDASGLTMNNQNISIQISVIDNETTIYTETHAITTTQFGLFTLNIGNGTPSLGDFSTIDWIKGNYNLTVAMDEKGGSDYTVMGESALKAVPYAMHAKTAANVFSGDYNDLKNKPKGGNKAPAGNPWLWEGNAGTTNGVDFIGTTDAQDLDIRVDNVIRFRATKKGQLEVLNTGGSVFIGEGAGANDDMYKTYNVFVGIKSGENNSSGSYNKASGAYSLNSNTTGYHNTASGALSLSKNTTGSYNTASGMSALEKNTTGIKNTASGAYSLRKNTTGTDNTANGYYALTKNTSGYENTASGIRSLYNNTIGHKNTANGTNSLAFNTIGHRNTASGYNSLALNDSGSYNTANGYHSLKSNINGSRNTANGNQSLQFNTTGFGNTANGTQSLYSNTVGYHNTANGGGALRANIGGAYNSAFGEGAFFGGANYFNSTALGHNTPISGSNQVHLGNTSVTEVKGQVPYAPYSDGRIKDNISENVKGLDFILKLRPVTYNFNKDRQDKLMGIVDSSEYAAKYDIEKIVFSGFIAQEVEKAADATNYNFSGVKKPKHANDLYALGYSEFVVPLVKAVQEQQEVITEQKEIIEKLNARLDAIEKQLK